MLLKESLTLNQQQLIIDSVIHLATKAGILNSNTELVDGIHLLLLLDDMAEMLSMERSVKYLTNGVIMPQGMAWATTRDEVDERSGLPREIKTSRIITKPGASHIDEFETLNTIYRAVPGVTFEDLRVITEPDH